MSNFLSDPDWVLVAGLLLSFGLGWYLGRRGISGVETDLQNVKAEIIKIKSDLTTPTPPVVSVPVTPPTS